MSCVSKKCKKHKLYFSLLTTIVCHPFSTTALLKDVPLTAISALSFVTTSECSHLNLTFSGATKGPFYKGGFCSGAAAYPLGAISLRYPYWTGVLGQGEKVVSAVTTSM